MIRDHDSPRTCMRQRNVQGCNRLSWRLEHAEFALIRLVLPVDKIIIA
jgi:hypothetical protein